MSLPHRCPPSSSNTTISSNTTSHLLSLPFPIRDLIFQHAFGSSALHIAYIPETHTWTNFFCREPTRSTSWTFDRIPHHEPHRPALILQPDVPEPVRASHEICQAEMDRRERLKRNSSSTTRNDSGDGGGHLFGAALACRQFYEEIIPMVYGSNVFMVESAITLVVFTEMLRRWARRKQDVRQNQASRASFSLLRLPPIHLRLSVISFTDATARYWPLALSPFVAQWVTSHVRRLEIIGNLTRLSAGGETNTGHSLMLFCSSVEVPSFAEDVQIQWQGLFKSERWSSRAPSPDRWKQQVPMRVNCGRSFKTLARTQMMVSPSWHVRNAVAKIRGLPRPQTGEEFEKEQSMEGVEEWPDTMHDHELM